MIRSGLLSRWATGLLAITILGSAGCAGSRPPALASVPPAAREHAPLWPQKLSWQASGRLSIHLPEGSMAGALHLLAIDGQSLRVVLMADGGVVLDDLLLTSRDRQVSGDGPLHRLAPMLRHAFLLVPEESPQWEQGLLTRNHPGDGIRRLYAGDPLALRQLQGAGGWAAISDYRLRGTVLVPHALDGAIGPVPWQLRLNRWQAQPTATAEPTASPAASGQNLPNGDPGPP